MPYRAKTPDVHCVRPTNGKWQRASGLTRRAELNDLFIYSQVKTTFPGTLSVGG